MIVAIGMKELFEVIPEALVLRDEEISVELTNGLLGYIRQFEKVKLTYRFHSFACFSPKLIILFYRND